ncbi:hypothetical protein NF27_DT02020 [Candidatus Jidaibacter acanthamoeba]|uniref:Uncharacterized protein n=1 Tax=Candidatus Jidaibacter acanthamoebae TaxID=86105 RepID=A0A0C1QN06_9RICK|nr:tetratricopeptide repeat protein [Candidatus Jidaibacter acanthamoeba]KIE05428.1 hypothetical protein NF27_DT02020 [Candidatus Jidaibacter acanthamoeba]
MKENTINIGLNEYKSSNYYLNNILPVKKITIPESDQEDTQPQVIFEIDINDLLIGFCEQFKLIIDEGNHDAIIDYYCQLVYQLSLSESLDLHKKTTKEISKAIVAFIGYIQESGLNNFKEIVLLQEKVANVINNNYSHTNLGQYLTLLYKNIAFLKQKSLSTSISTPQERTLSLKIDPNQVLEILNDISMALKKSQCEREASDTALEIDSNISKYTYQLCYEILEQTLEDNTLKNRGDNQAPDKFTKTLNNYWNLLKLLSCSNKDIDVEPLARNIIFKASEVINTHQTRLHGNSIESQGYQYSLSDLDKLVTYNTQLMLESYDLSSNSPHFIWRENWNKLRDIRRESVNLNALDQQVFLSEEISNLIRRLIQEAGDILGKPPCEYIVLSFGSLSRKELFSCSDLECLVVLDTENKLVPSVTRYFTILFKLIDVQLRTLGEYGEGLGLDKNNPVLNYDEFVITINNLEKVYNLHRDDTKESYHYSLLKPDLLYSSNEDNLLFEKYKEIMSQTLSSINKEQSLKQLKTHIEDYFRLSNEQLNSVMLGSNKNSYANKNIDLKKCFYSPLVYLAIDLGLYYNIKSNNTLKIYEELYKQGFISGKFFESLKEGYCYIIELRNEAHILKGSQYDKVFLPTNNKSGHLVLREEAFEKLKRINLEVITPLYKALELITTNTQFIKDALDITVSSGELNLAFHALTGTNEETTIYFPDQIAKYYYEARNANINNTEHALDDPIILSELIALYQDHYRWQYCLESITQENMPTEHPIIQINSINLGDKYLIPEVSKELFNSNGKFIADEALSGTHQVKPIEYGTHKLHAKFSPELPGIEKAVELLSQLLVGSGTTSLTEFIRCKVITKDKKEHTYPLLLSSTIEGKTVASLDVSKIKFDTRELSKALIASAVTRQEDGHPKNYIIELLNSNTYRLVCIDKDHGFVEPIITKDTKPILMFTSIIYCLEQVKELHIDTAIIKDLSRINIDIMLTRWLEELDKIHKYHVGYQQPDGKHIQGIWSELEIEKYYNKKEGYLPNFLGEKIDEPRCIIPIVIGEKTLRETYELLWQIQQNLREKDIFTPQLILKYINPLVSKIYERMLPKKIHNAFKYFNTLSEVKASYFKVNKGNKQIQSNIENYQDSRVTIDQRVQSIAGKILTLKDIREQKHLTPAGALEELKLLKNWQAFINEAKEEIKQGKISNIYNKLLPIHREILINNIDAKEIGGGQNIISLLKTYKTNFHRLILKGYNSLPDAELWDLIWDSKMLISLGLINIRGLTGTCFSDGVMYYGIAGHCNLLEKLILENLTNLNFLGTRKHITLFANLRRLEIRNCDKLQVVNIETPKLNELELSNCESLAKFIFRTNETMQKFMLPKNLGKVSLIGCTVDNEELSNVDIWGKDECNYGVGLKVIYEDLKAQGKINVVNLLLAKRGKEVSLSYSKQGKINKKLKQYSEAIDSYTKAIELNPNVASHYNSRGEVYFCLREYDKAIADIEQAIHIKPGNALYYNNRGEAYYYLRKYKEAVKDYTQAIQLYSISAVYYNNRGKAYNYLKEYDKAKADHVQAIKLDPTNAAYYNYYGKTLFDLKQYDKAVIEYSKALELVKSDSIYYSNRGFAYKKLGCYDKAVKDYDKAISLDSNESYYYYERGDIYYHLNQFDKSIQDYNQAIRIDSNKADYYSRRGLSYLSINQFELASIDFGLSISINELLPNPYIGRAKIYLLEGKLKEALNEVNHAIGLITYTGASYVLAYTTKGQIFYSMNSFEKSLKCYKRALEVDVNCVEASNGLKEAEKGLIEENGTFAHNIFKELNATAMKLCKATIPLSQALRHQMQFTSSRDMNLLRKSETCCISYLPIDLIVHTLSFLPEAEILHKTTITKLLESFVSNRVVSRTKIEDDLLKIPEQICFTVKLMYQRKEVVVRESI